MIYQAACVCDAGIHRNNNEDNFLFSGQFLPEKNEGLEYPLTMEFSGDTYTLFAVFDGMGGASLGEKASYLAASRFNSAAGNLDDTEALSSLINSVNREISCVSEKLPINDMGTTVVGAYIKNEQITLFNLGDSRLYLLRGKTLYQMTKDHNNADMLEALGIKNRKPSLSQYLGMSSEIQPEPYLQQETIFAGDKWILCSDGLTEKLDDLEILRMLRDYADPMEALQYLLSRAREKHASDNITAILIQAQSGRYSV